MNAEHDKGKHKSGSVKVDHKKRRWTRNGWSYVNSILGSPARVVAVQTIKLPEGTGKGRRECIDEAYASDMAAGTWIQHVKKLHPQVLIPSMLPFRPLDRNKIE